MSPRVSAVPIELTPGAAIPALALVLITVYRFGFARGAVAALLFIASLLAHETGHVLMAKLTGTRYSAIGFCARGAYTRRERASGGTEIAISAAGPLVNLALGLLLWHGWGILAWLAQINVVLALFNLLPFRNSDGYRIQHVLIERFGFRKPVVRDDGKLTSNSSADRA